MSDFYFNAPTASTMPARVEVADYESRNMRWRLFRHFDPAFRVGVDVWILHDGTVTTFAPDPTLIRLFFRAGTRAVLTPADAALLLEAGQTILLPDGVTEWQPGVGLTWDEAAQLTWDDLAHFKWSDL